jgi:hypothetical protein
MLQLKTSKREAATQTVGASCLRFTKTKSRPERVCLNFNRQNIKYPIPAASALAIKKMLCLENV